MGLKQHWFYILLALAQGATHGAEIRRRVAEHTEDTLKLYPAMLYGSLEDLQDQGYIAEIDARKLYAREAAPSMSSWWSSVGFSRVALAYMIAARFRAASRRLGLEPGEYQDALDCRLFERPGQKQLGLPF